jgi:hypothetical protein
MYFYIEAEMLLINLNVIINSAKHCRHIGLNLFWMIIVFTKYYIGGWVKRIENSRPAHATQGDPVSKKNHQMAIEFSSIFLNHWCFLYCSWLKFI